MLGRAKFQGNGEPTVPVFDNICTLPLLSSDIFTQALHPSEPILTVGLAGGHVQTYRLPSLEHTSSTQSSNGNGAKVQSSRRDSETGFDLLSTAWRTQRHKGSCRALAFSTDGSQLYSAGTDAVIKIADSETGRVTCKFNLPQSSQHTFDTPVVLHTLSPQNLLLGTEYGSLHVYDTRAPTSKLLARPSQSLRPHFDKEQPSNAAEETITSITPLPPTTSSTSGTSRSWITTTFESLALSDLRKGVVSLSAPQSDLCLSSTCVSGDGVGKKRKVNGDAGSGEKIIVGSESALSVWERGSWSDQRGRIPIYDEDKGKASFDSGAVEALVTMPDEVKINGSRAGAGVVVAGLGNGRIQIVRIRGRGGDIIGSLGHDDLEQEGVTTLGFDVSGRLISGGGRIIKIWHEKSGGDLSELDEEEEDTRGGQQETIQMGDVSEEDDDESEQASSNEEQVVVKKRKKNNAAAGKHGAHGVLAFSGMD